MSVLSVRLHDPFLYMRFKEKAKREGLTISQLLEKLIIESLKEKKNLSLPPDKLFVLNESLKILSQAKAFCSMIPISIEKQRELKQFLDVQVRDLQRKVKFEGR